MTAIDLTPAPPPAKITYKEISTSRSAYTAEHLQLEFVVSAEKTTTASTAHTAYTAERPLFNMTVCDTHTNYLTALIGSRREQESSVDGSIARGPI